MPVLPRPAGPPRIGLHIAAPTSWESVKAQALTAELAGFDVVTLPDHVMSDPAEGASRPMLECFVALGGIAAATRRIRLGPLVAPVSLRNPAMVAKMVATLDAMSGGRAFYGIGAGWAEYEHRGYGVGFDAIPVRLRRVEEAVLVARAMWARQPATFAGELYRVDDALCDPPPVQARLPVMIGGSGERRTLPLAARLGDACNVFGSPVEAAHKFAIVRRHCAAAGRPPEEVAKTVTSWALLGRDEREVSAKRTRFEGRLPGFSGVVGTPAAVAQRLREYRRAGADEVHLLIPDGDELESIRLLGRLVLPLL